MCLSTRPPEPDVGCGWVLRGRRLCWGESWPPLLCGGGKEGGCKRPEETQPLRLLCPPRLRLAWRDPNPSAFQRGAGPGLGQRAPQEGPQAGWVAELCLGQVASLEMAPGKGWAQDTQGRPRQRGGVGLPGTWACLHRGFPAGYLVQAHLGRVGGVCPSGKLSAAESLLWCLPSGSFLLPVTLLNKRPGTHWAGALLPSGVVWGPSEARTERVSSMKPPRLYLGCTSGLGTLWPPEFTPALLVLTAVKSSSSLPIRLPPRLRLSVPAHPALPCLLLNCSRQFPTAQGHGSDPQDPSGPVPHTSLAFLATALLQALSTWAMAPSSLPNSVAAIPYV